MYNTVVVVQICESSHFSNDANKNLDAICISGAYRQM